MNSLQRGKRASGDMIPWTVSQQFNDHEFGNLSGARIVRIATHPDFQKVHMGCFFIFFYLVLWPTQDKRSS